jgi:hypothetical protein
VSPSANQPCVTFYACCCRWKFNPHYCSLELADEIKSSVTVRPPDVGSTCHLGISERARPIGLAPVGCRRRVKTSKLGQVSPPATEQASRPAEGLEPATSRTTSTRPLSPQVIHTLFLLPSFHPLNQSILLKSESLTKPSNCHRKAPIQDTRLHPAPCAVPPPTDQATHSSTHLELRASADKNLITEACQVARI